MFINVNYVSVRFLLVSADGIMIVFSITDEGSFEMLKELHQQVERNISESVSNFYLSFVKKCTFYSLKSEGNIIRCKRWQ